MAKYGPVLIVEDDKDDQEMYKSIIESFHVRNKIIFFENGEEILSYLMATTQQPFLILCDVNLPRMNGLELRRRIDADEVLRKKSIPFVFVSTTDKKDVVDEAYNLTVQGFFIKGSTYSEIVTQLKLVFDYWKACRHPNQY